MIAAGADIEAKNDGAATALLIASRAGNMQAVVVLADAGAAVDVVESEGRMTPLLYVANRGDLYSPFMCEQTGGSAARALILHGANLRACNEDGDMARTFAERIHHTEVLKVIDEFGD